MRLNIEFDVPGVPETNSLTRDERHLIEAVQRIYSMAPQVIGSEIRGIIPLMYAYTAFVFRKSRHDLLHDERKFFNLEFEFFTHNLYQRPIAAEYCRRKLEAMINGAFQTQTQDGEAKDNPQASTQSGPGDESAAPDTPTTR